MAGTSAISVLPGPVAVLLLLLSIAVLTVCLDRIRWWSRWWRERAPRRRQWQQELERTEANPEERLEDWQLAMAFGEPLLRAAADTRLPRTQRTACLVGVSLLVTVLVMTYSRGGLLAFAAGLAVLLALDADRVRTLTHLGAALLAALLPLIVALGRPDLSTNFIPVQRRTDDGIDLPMFATVPHTELVTHMQQAALRLLSLEPTRV